MSLRLDDHWVWDFWLVTDEDEHHVFFLKAPKAIGDPEDRHWNVSIGHAVSTDLASWRVVADALSPSSSTAWDDKSTWTGSIIGHHGGWVMLYTGTSHADEGLVQRVGLATSQDLHEWQRVADPVLLTDPELYETLAHDMWHDEAWRDPWLFRDPDDEHVHVFLTARANTGDRYDRGVIGHARSRDLLTWEVLPPITAPPGFGQLEVPQLLEMNGRWYLLFASDLETQSAERRATGPGTGTYYMVGDSPYGPFTMLGDGVLEADATGTTYAGKIHHTLDGVPWFLAWNRVAVNGDFVGDLAAPRRVEIASDGSLSIAVAAFSR